MNNVYANVTQALRPDTPALGILHDIMRNQCEATAPASTYTAAHRCLKKGKKNGGRRLCPHHARMEHVPVWTAQEAMAARA